MNFKTTGLLASVLIILAMGYYILQQRETPSAESTETASQLDQIAPNVIEDKLGDVVKVVCQLRGQEEWVFEKNTDSPGAAASSWSLTAPFAMKVVGWEVDRFWRDLGSLTCDISYEPSAPGGVSATDAGLDPPKARITLIDDAGKRATVEIGQLASPGETYVRLAGSEAVCVVGRDLKSLMKRDVLEYRDRSIWSFEPENVTRVEAISRTESSESVSYVFARQGDGWVIESPVTARATSKVDDMLRELGRLRALKWFDARDEALPAYGLDAPMLTLKVFAEEDMPQEAAGDTDGASEPDKPQTRQVIYALSVSDRSPIGDATKTYVRVGDEPMAATILKTAADKFTPVLSEWREMHLTTANVTSATRIELAAESEPIALVKHADGWQFESTGSPVDAIAVSAMLREIQDLRAVRFVESEPGHEAVFGLDRPQGDIRLTIPGVEGTVRIAVGSYTDANAKRLMYARRDDLSSIAKVRAADVSLLLRPATAYRDRTVFQLSPTQIQQLDLTTQSRFGQKPTRITLSRDGDGWAITEPVDLQARATSVEKLVESLASLEAEEIVGGADELAMFGLSDPDATVSLVLRPPADAIDLIATEHDGNAYAKRSDRPDIYRIPTATYRQLFAEFAAREIMRFDDTKVASLMIRSGSTTHTFERADGQWIYVPEPDLPLDAKKVDHLLLQVRDLRTERYYGYEIADLAPLGLDSPAHEVTVQMDDGETAHILRLSDIPCPTDVEARLPAIVQGQPGVLLLTPDVLNRLRVDLNELEAR